MSYTTKEKVSDYISMDIDASMDARIAEWAEAVDEYIHKKTGVYSFEADTVDSVKYYDGNGLKEMIIDDYVDITSIEILDETTDDVNFTLLPGRVVDFTSRPINTDNKYKVRVTPNSQISYIPMGCDNIKVTAKWGYSVSVPKQISFAATLLVHGILQQGMEGGKIKKEVLGDYEVSFEMIEDSAQMMGVARILQPFTKIVL